MLETQEKTLSTESTTRMNGAKAIMECLVHEGVELIYGYPGGAIMPVYDALYDYQDQVQHVLTRHEQGATHAAQGYARVTNKTGVVFATSGPGATNLVTGLADALIDSTPMVCITGQVFAKLLGTDAFQETDVISITMAVTKWNYQITKASEIPDVMAKAFYIANSGRPGPVIIDITKNAQLELLDFAYKKTTAIRSYNPIQKADENELTKAAELLNNAKKPYILFGQGVTLSGAETELKQLVEKSGIPAAWTILGLSAMETDHPLNVGMLGMHGNYAPNVLTNECDVLFAVGMRFDDRVTGKVDGYAPQAKVIHLDIDPSEINKIIEADVALVGDAKETLQRLLPLIEQNVHPEWLQQFKDLDQMEWDKVIEKEIQPKEGLITMGEVIHLINEETEGDHIIVTDVGQHQMVACRYAKFAKHRSNVTSGGLGTMGFALPAGLGAQMGAPDRCVIAVIGDGGFQMTIQELATIAQTKTPLKILILNNQFLGMVRQWQELFFDKRYSSVELENPDFQMISEGMGVPAILTKERASLKADIQKWLNHEGPCLLEVRVGKENNVFPMVPAGATVAEIRLD
ncbi:MAG: biosynthetic-type acetolactate synthase large subunit [Saprospiraceae bacterium]|nr:biosynthetic-type acetolactate synthase large subunit [Saprospiraceae bacterium]